MINKNTNKNQYHLNDFSPLIGIFTAIIVFTVTKQVLYGFNLHNAMADFMGSFFIIFGLFKIIHLRGFAEAYSTYDIIAHRSTIYAHLYPFIELSLGIMYLTQFKLVVANYITLFLMIINSIGVGYELAQNKKITCACLGTVFKIPMTYVTLAEDIIMGIMALLMLIM